MLKVLFVVVFAADPLQAALALEAAGKDAEALVAVERVLRSDPSSALARLEAGRLRLKIGEDISLAEAELDAARSIAPENPRAHFLYGQVLEEQRRLPEAARAYEAALALRDDYDDARLRLAGLQVAARDFAGATAGYRKYTQAHPEATGARLQLAMALEKAGMESAAERELKALHALPATKEVAARRLADFYERQGKAKEAAKYRAFVDRPGRKLRPLLPSR